MKNIAIKTTQSKGNGDDYFKLEIDMEFTRYLSEKRVDSIYRNVAHIGAEEMGSVSDGYHTFDELYEHRIALYITLLRTIKAYGKQAEAPQEIAQARFIRFRHYIGWFCLGAEFPGIGQVSYHLPEHLWDKCDFAEEGTWEFDEHTSKDVVERLAKISALMN